MASAKKQKARLRLSRSPSARQAHPHRGSHRLQRLGALDAAREHKREKHVAIVGQDCIAEAIAEMQMEKSPLIGSVSHESSSYGPSLIHLGLSLLRGQTVSTYKYIIHKMFTRESLQ